MRDDETVGAKGEEAAKDAVVAPGATTEFFIATGRLKHGERIPDSAEGPIPADATLRERMGRKLKTKKGQAVYAQHRHAFQAGQFGLTVCRTQKQPSPRSECVLGYWFDNEQRFVDFYMGHPLNRQPWANSPFGNALGVAVQHPGHKATKLGVAIAPSDTPGHWPSGYLGGLQLLPGTSDRWIGVINASPSAPIRDGDLTGEEPPHRSAA